MSDWTVDDLGDVYRFTWPEHQVRVDVSRLRAAREGRVMAEIRVISMRQPRPGLLHQGELYLLSTSGKQALARSMPDWDGMIDWPNVIETFCYVSLEKWRLGEAPLDLRDVTLGERSRWVVEPFVETGGPTDLFGSGGDGKSLLALGIALTLTTGRPIIGQPRIEPAPALYLDWETDEAAHAERMRALLSGMREEVDPAAAKPLYYRRQAAPLAASLDGLRQWIADLNIGLVVIDSRGVAAGGQLESSEATLELFRAIRALGRPCLIVDHVSKDVAAGNSKKLPYGNIYAHNTARLTWHVTKAQDAGSGRLTVALANIKSNNSRAGRRLAYHLDFVTGDEASGGELYQIGVTPTDVRDVPELRGKLPAAERIRDALGRCGALSKAELSDMFEAEGEPVSGAAIEQALTRGKQAGNFILLPGRRWGLLA